MLKSIIGNLKSIIDSGLYQRLVEATCVANSDNVASVPNSDNVASVAA